MVAIKRHFGWQPDPAGVEAFLATQPHPVFGLAAHELIGADDGEVLLYRPLLQLMPDWGPHNQGIGDCVSHGWGLGVDCLTAVEIVSRREPERWVAEAATEAIYGGSRVEARGRKSAGFSDGSYGGAAAKWVKNWGILHRVHYDAQDLSQYSSRLAKSWGNSGVPDVLEPTAREHPVRTVSLVTSFDEAAAAIANGYPVPVCSGQGFSSKRDSEGFARASGSWAHCMLFWGVRHGRRPGLLCQNSWGKWNSGPRWPSDMPAGSFWVEAAVVDRMLRGRDSFAISNFEGFPARRFDWSAVFTPIK